MKKTLASAALVVAACSSGDPGLRRPEYPAARSGVWNSPVAVVEGTDDEMMPDVAASGWLVYSSKTNGNVDIYRRPFNGGSAERLTEHSADDTDPAFSPKGDRIAFRSQSSDVKGDIYIMDADGGDREQITDRRTADSGPCWAPSGDALYFTSSELGGRERIERVDLEYGTRTVIAEDAWDPAVHPNGDVLFFAALDERRHTRIFALRLSDGARAPVTDGVYPEAFPKVRKRDEAIEVLMVRFTDDDNRDRRLDGEDGASLWAAPFSDALFEGAEPARASPLTSGAGTELFVSAVGDSVVYTTAGFGDLEIYALPSDGMIAREAGNEAILEAAASEDNPSLRRLGLRYLVVNAPELEGPARYQLARELAEREFFRESVAELARAAVAFGDDPMAEVSRVEIVRLGMLMAMDGRWLARDEGQRSRVRRELEGLEAKPRETDAVRARVAVTLAEGALALGRRARAVRSLEAIAQDESVPGEDRARALDRLSDAYGRLGDAPTLIRLCERLLRELPGERYYARRCAERWVEAAARPVGVPSAEVEPGTNALGLSILAELESIAESYSDIPMLAARARAELANRQSELGYESEAREAWRRIVEDLPGEREVLSRALLSLAEGAENRGELDLALDGYEQLAAQFSDDPELRARARRGISRIALLRAEREEAQGNLEAALEDYRRILANDRELTVAHRRYIRISDALGRLEEVQREYRAAVEKDGRDKLARYGLGYALTFGEDPDIYAAERQIRAALELDPRLTPGHLTLGWIRMQRERREPREGWAEKAADSFKVAEDLADRGTEARLYAAARLNSGNALYALNKLDDAFLAYLDRERDRTPFDDPLTELIFRERFARTALREDHLDVALDQATLAHRHLLRIEGQPRRASIAALIGAIYFLAESYARALPWLSDAQATFQEAQDWDRAIPLLRTSSLAEIRLGRLDRAAERLNEIRTLLASGRAPADPARPIFENFEILLWSEVPAKADDVTLGPYGFTREVELQLADALAARTQIAEGQLEDALALMEARLALLREIQKRGGTGGRARPEWIVALNEAGRVAARAGVAPRAHDYFMEALEAASAGGRPRALIQLSESLLWLWIAHPELGSTNDRDRVAAALDEARERGDPDEARKAASVAGLVSLFRLDRDRSSLSAPLPPTERAEEALAARLDRLDHVATQANRVEQIANQWQLKTLRNRVAPGPYAPRDEAQPVEEANEERQRRAAGTEPKSTTTAPTEPSIADEAARDETTEGDAPPGPHDALGPRSAPKRDRAQGALEDTGSDAPAQGLIRASFRRRLAPWRVEYDRSLRDGSDALAAAIDAFLADPLPSGAPELTRFLRDAEALALERDERERAWRLLEHARLLALQPSPARRARGRVLPEWRALIESRGTEAYAPEKASALIRALEGVATTLDPLRKLLGDDSALIQLFAAEDEWRWYAIDAGRIERFCAEVDRDALPSELSAWLKANPSLKTLYLDVGEERMRPAWRLAHRDTPLGEAYEVSEVLSATYLLASYEARNLSTGAPVRYGEGGAEALTERASVLAFPPPLRAYGEALRPGEAQVLLSVDSSEPIDLDHLAARSLMPQVVFVGGVDSPRSARLVAQAALIAGGPSTLTVGGALDGQVEALATLVEEQRISRALGTLQGLADDARLWGYRGMNLVERVLFAYDETLKVARVAGPLYRQADGSGDFEVLERANRALATTVRLVEYLLVPSHLEAFRGTEVGAGRAGSLPRFLLIFRGQRANVLSQLGRLDDASRVRRELIAQYEANGAARDALNQMLQLGIALNDGGRHEAARDAFQRCVEVAAAEGSAILEADCRSRLGSVHRSLYDYDAARESYESAIALYQREDHPDQVAPARYLGFLYESALSDYEAALVQFEIALEAAKRFEEERDKVPGLYLDIARIQRLRGEYDRALETVEEARTQVPADRVDQLTQVEIETANIYWYRGDYRRARQAQTRALEQSVRTGNTSLRIRSLSVGGLIAMNQGELGEAERLIRKALELSRITHRKAEEAAQLNNLGVVLQRGSRVPEAVESFAAALAIDEKLGSREGRAFDLRNLGTAYGRLGQYDKALEALEEALALSQELGIRFNEVESLFRRGEVLEAVDRDAEADAMFDQAATLSTRISLPEVRWRSLYALGRLEEERGQLDSARRYFLEALEVAEQLGRSRDESTRGATRDDLYEDAIRLAADADDLPQVFELLERRRARARLDAFANRNVRLNSDDAQRLRRLELRARERVQAAQRDVARGKDGATEQLEAALRAYQARHAELEARFPRVARTFTLEPVPLERLQAALPERTRVLSYLLGSRRSYVMTIGTESVRLTRLEANRDELEPLVTELVSQLRAFAPVDDALRSLGGLLLAPVEAELTDADRVVVVPDEALSRIPFPALRVGERAAVERWSISEASGASVLTELLAASPVRVRRVSAFAYGVDLPYAKLEARAVSATPAVASEATIERLRRAPGEAWALAVHGVLDPKDPLASALELAPSESHDGRLRAFEIFALPRVPPLVTLSACETATRSRDGNARLGLADSFITAGAQSVVASHHRVSDFASALMMKWFYRYQPSTSTSDALRRAMLRVREDHPHPAHWATFSLVGDFR